MKSCHHLLIYAVIAVAASALSRAGEPAEPTELRRLDQDNIVIVLDASGSMKRSFRVGGEEKGGFRLFGGRGKKVVKMDAAKDALLKVLETVPPQTNVGVLVFSAGNLEDDWVYPLAPLNYATAKDAILLPRPDGRTPLGEYIGKGTDRLLAQRRKQHGYGTYRLLVVTDGKASDEELVARNVPRAMGSGVVIDVIGIDMDDDLELASEVNSYRSAADSEALQRAVAEVFAEVSAGSAAGDGGEDAFAVVAPVPEAVAQAALDAMAAIDDAAEPENDARE